MNISGTGKKRIKNQIEKKRLRMFLVLFYSPCTALQCVVPLASPVLVTIVNHLIFCPLFCPYLWYLASHLISAHKGTPIYAFESPRFQKSVASPMNKVQNRQHQNVSLQTSGVPVHPQCVQVFNDLRLHSKYRYVIYRLTDDLREIQVCNTAPPSECFLLYPVERTLY